MSLRHVSEFLYCPVIFGECEAEATHKDDEPPKCHECGFPANVHLVHWYCNTCYAGLNETHSED